MGFDSISLPTQHDTGLEAFLNRVLALRELEHGTHPDAYLAALAALRAELAELAKSRDALDLRAEFEDFARHRFTLVDAGDEYAVAAEEVLVLSLASADTPVLCTRALQDTLITLSGVLGEQGAPRQFGRLLGRLRQIARQTEDAELKAWVDGVVAALPGDEPG